MAHNQQLGVAFPHRFSIELQRSLVKPLGSWLLVVVKAQPNVAELTHLRVVFAPSQVYDVGYAEGLQLLGVCLGLYCASKREPFAHEEGLHRLGLLLVPHRPRRLENLYLPNAVFVGFVPAVSVTCSLTFIGDF